MTEIEMNINMTDYLNLFKDKFVDDDIYSGHEMMGDKYAVELAYIKEFRFAWFATQLNIFIAVSQFEDKITKEVIEDYSKIIFEYSIKNHKGWPRGLQAGVGSISVLIGDNATNDAIGFCEKLSKRHWSAFEVPVIINLSRKQTISFIKKPIWGAVYFPYIKMLIETKIDSLVKTI